MKDIRCLLGWHEWTWKLSDEGVVRLNAPPPNHAKCSRCNLTYKDRTR